MIIKRFTNDINVNSPVTGQPFLRNGISCSEGGSNRSFQDVTTFREDYSNPSNPTRRKQFEPPLPASVIHKNECFLKLEGSLTQDTYRSSSFKNRDNSGSRRLKPGSMNKTNFHMSADKRLETVHTTNQVGFPPLTPECLWDTSRFARYKDVDAGPLGKRFINPLVRSEYNSMYSEGSEAMRGVKGAGVSLLGADGAKSARNTITGCHVDGECGNRVTTHCETYRGEPLTITNPPTNTARIQQLRITSIPEGDRSKAAKPSSNSQLSYNNPPLLTAHTYNKSKAVREILGASIQLSDYAKSPKEYFSTTATDTYHQHPNTGRIIPHVRFPRNASFHPRGDLEPTRVTRRITHSTTKKAHVEPPCDTYPTHVDSSGWRTLSHFDIGGDAGPTHPGSGDQAPLSSTMASSYLPVSQAPHRVRAPSHDNLPLNYFPGHLSNSTTADSYPKYTVQSRLDQINKTALENLKCSHWRLPRMTSRHSYSTTNRDCFTVPPSK